MRSTLPLIVKIYAAGSPVQLGLGNKILNFSYEDVEKGDDLARITFADPFHELVDSEQFVENSEWVVQWGFAGNLYPAKKILIKRPRFRYGELEIEGLDKGSALKVEENWGVAKQKTMSEIVDDIAKKHGLKSDVDKALDQIIPFFLYGGMTDWDVLEFFESKLEDHVFKILNDKLVFKKRDLEKAPVASFDYSPGRNSRILDYEISIKDQDNAKGSGKTTAVGIDPFAFKKAIFSAHEGNTPTGNLGNRRTNSNYKPGYSGSIPSVQSVKTSGGTSQDSTQGDSTGKSLIVPPGFSLEGVAKGHRRSSLLGTVEGEFTISADPKDPFYKNADIISIRNIGTKFSGLYKIIEVTHDLSDGYTYKMRTRRNAVNTTTAAAAILNGAINKKIPKENTVEKIKKSIVGTLTGVVYGNLGRIL